MKTIFIIVLSALAICGCSRTNSNPITSCAPRTTPATDNIKGQSVGLAELVDAGNTTPEAAWESRYWARAQGDYDAVIAATHPQAIDGAKGWMGDKASFSVRSKRNSPAFKA